MVHHSVFSGAINENPGHRNGVIANFQTNLDTFYNKMMVASLFRGMVGNTNYQRVFVIVILAY